MPRFGKCRTCEKPIILRTDRNVKYCSIRCTSRIGESAPFHKLTWAQVAEIRETYVPWKNGRELAKKFGIAVGTLRNIAGGFTWTFNKKHRKRKQYGRRFSDDQVKEIRKRLEKGESQRVIAASLNAHQSTISFIKNSQTYQGIGV